MPTAALVTARLRAVASRAIVTEASDALRKGKEVFMFDHIGLKVKDLDASVRFYTAALGPLGYEATSQDESSAAFGAKGTYTLWLYADARLAHSLVHIAFTAGNR